MAFKEFSIETSLLPKLLVRCRGKECRQFFVKAKVATAGCACCDWHTAFCHDCGGDLACERSLVSHVYYFARNKKALERYGQAHRAMTMAAEDRPRRKRSALKQAA